MEEFRDKEREVAEEGKTLKELLSKGAIEILKDRCRTLIDKDPDYLEPYLILHEIYEIEGDLKSADEILTRAFERAMNLIAPEGKLPDRLPWSHEPNRHIINTLISTGVFYWELGEIDRSLEILSKVYRMNPSDEPGVRYYILAILEGMSLQEFEQVFMKEGEPDREDLERWFAKHAPGHPDYFQTQDV